MSSETLALDMADEREAGTIFDRLLSLSSAALVAIESEDMEKLSSVMTLRQRLIDDFSGPLPLDGLETALELQAADRQLALAIQSRRQDVGDDLGDIESRGAARSAYGPRRRTRSNIDIRR